MDQNERKAIQDALIAKGADRPCPRCGGKWEVTDKYGIPGVQDQHPSKGLNIGQAIPSAVLVCTDCGFIALHALAVLNP